MKFDAATTRRMYDRLRIEYRAIPEMLFCSVCPPKIAVDARPGFTTGQWQMPLAAMVAKLQDGTAGVKAVILNENTGDMTSYTSVFYPDGTSKVVDSTELTRFRCALMAALATDGRVELNSGSRVGFIGAGRINLITAQVFKDLFDVEDFVIVGSKTDPAKNYDKFWEIGRTQIDASLNDYDKLKTCDVIVSATTAMGVEDVIEYDLLRGCKLFIAQDSGFIFGESFRQNCKSFSDSPAQLGSHWHNEFPWDSHERNYAINDLNELNYDKSTPSAVYLYGIALADVVVAEAA